MMRHALLFAAIAGCNHAAAPAGVPPDTAPGADGPAADAADGVDAPRPTPLGRGYIIDGVNGVYRVAKDPATGLLSLTSSTATPSGGFGGPVAAAIDGRGDHLYVADAAGKSLHDFAVQADGSLVAAGVQGLAPCIPSYGVTHPSGGFVAFGCTTANFAIAPIATDGTLGAPSITAAGTNPISPAFSPDGRCLYFADLNGAAVLAYRFDASTGAVAALASAPASRVPRGIAIDPGGRFVYAGTSTNTVNAYAIASDCTLTPIGTAPCGPNTELVGVDPIGRNLFVAGTEIYRYQIASDGTLTAMPGNPFLRGGSTMFGLATDPAFPDLLYITGAALGGTVIARVTDTGVEQIAALATGASNSRWLQLAP
jgi:sugar lactone lactonase YvrE